MIRIDLKSRSTADLVDNFAAIGVEQDDALLKDEIARFNRLYDKLVAIRAELRSRPGDERKALLVLYKHANMQTRLNAAKSTRLSLPSKPAGCWSGLLSQSGIRKPPTRACA